MPTSNLRFVILGEDRASAAFNRFAGNVDKASRAVERNRASMKQAGADEQSFGQHLAKLSNDVLGFGDAQAVAEKKNSLFRRGLAAASLATGLLEPQMASLIVTAGGLAAAAASAGLGFAAYAAAARPALQGVMQAVQAQGKVQAASTAAQGSYQASLAAAQTRYRLSLGSATTAAQRSAAATALLNAQHSALAAKVRATTLASANYKAQLAGLTPVQRALATGIVGAQKAYQGWAMQFARPILTPFIRMLSVVHPLLAAFSPVVRQAAAAVEILSNQFISVVQGGGLQRWLAGMIPHIAPVIISLGHIIGHLVVGIGGILRAFAPAGQGIMAWLDKITAAFARWGQTLPQHTGFQSLFAMVNKDAPVLRDLLKNVAIAAVNVGRAMTGISTPANSRTLLVALQPVAALLAQLSRNQALVQMIFYMALLGKVTSRIKPAFDAAAGSIGGIYKAVRGLSSGAMDVGGLAGQINRFRAGFGDAAVAGGKLSGVAGTLGGKFRQLTSWIGSGIGSIREWGIWTKIAEGATALYEVSLGRAVLAIRSWTIWSKVAAVATKVWAAVQVAFNAVMDANPIALVVIGIAALIAIVILAYKRFAWFRDFVNTVGRFIAQHWQIMLALITGGLSLAVVFIIKHWTLILNIAKTVINWVRDHWALLLIALTGPFGLVVVAIIKNWNRILDTAKTVINGIRIAWNAMGGFLRQVAMTFQGMWINVVAKILDVARAAFGWLPFGVGKNITAAANHFDTLRTRWNAAMHGMNNRKISIAVNMIDAAIGSGGGGGSGVNTGHSIAGRARGGPIRGPGGPEDDRAGLYALSHDEYVVRARAHRKYGTRFLDLINRGQLPEDTARIGRRALGGPIRGPGDMAAIDVQTQIPAERDMTGVMLPQLRKLAASWAKKHIFSGLWNPALSSAMVRYALQYVGRPYVWGGTTPAGWDCCLVSGVRIYGPRGAIPIEDITAGDLVYSYEDGRRVAAKVTRQWKSEHQPVFAVRTRNRTVTASANHPFLRLVQVERARSVKDRKRQASRYEAEWVRLDQLRRGDLLVQPRSLATEPAGEPVLAAGTTVDADVAWLLGAITGDGTVTAKGLNLALYGERRDRATDIIASRWGSTVGHSAKHGLFVSSARLRDELTLAGLRRPGPDKRLPAEVWEWPADLQRAFLNGYCDADGHRPARIDQHGQRTYHSASRELIEDTRALHITLGDAVSNVHVTRRTAPIVIKGKTVRNARDQHAFTVWSGKRQGTWAAEFNQGIAAWAAANPDFTATRLLAVTPAGEADTWDLEIDGTHSFIADGLVVHNSGFTSWVYHHFGIPAPRTSQQQQLWARPSGDVPGALVFFYGRNGTASHVGLAIGGGQMVNAEDPAMGTRVASVGGNTGFGLPPGAVQNNIFGALFGGGGRQTPIELGRSMAAAIYGWRGAEWSALYRLWMRESGWNPNARNPSSGAAGIPQDITGNFHGGARGQISWGLNYIRNRYGDPLRAWAHEMGAGWYDRGGLLPPGVSLAVNNTGRPERVVAPGQDRPEVTVNVGPVTVTEAADVDLLARRLGFGISAAGFA